MHLLKRLWRMPIVACLSAGAVLGAPTALAGATTTPPTWSVLSPPVSPPALRNAAAAYDGANDTVVVFGGEGADGALSDATWVWNGSTWSQASPYGVVPAARQEATMAFDPSLDQLVLFGGEGANGVLLDDTWAWNGASWNEITTATTPGGREGAALAADQSGQLVLFGGYGLSNAPLVVPPTSTTTSTTTGGSTTTAPSSTSSSSTSSTTSTTSTSTSTTTTIPTTTTTTAPAPPPAIAGENTPMPLDDTWLLGRDASGADQWTAATTTTSPPPLAGAVLANAGSGTVLFGGVDGAPGSSSETHLSDATWEWNGSDWAEVTTKAAPPARQEAAAAYDSDLGELVVLGGLDASGALGDAWVYQNGAWSPLTATTPPAPRSGALAVYDADSHQLLLFGGTSSTGTALSQTEVLTKEPPAQVTTTPSNVTSPPTTTKGQTVSSQAPGSTSTSPPTTTPLVAASATLHRGDVVTLTGSGFIPGAEITITFHSVPAVVVARTRANAAGRFRASVTVPVDAAVGAHHFIASGKGPHGVTTLTTEVRVVALALHHGISLTDTSALTAIALAVPALTWLALSVLSRRRRRAVQA